MPFDISISKIGYIFTPSPSLSISTNYFIALYWYQLKVFFLPILVPISTIVIGLAFNILNHFISNFLHSLYNIYIIIGNVLLYLITFLEWLFYVINFIIKLGSIYFNIIIKFRSFLVNKFIFFIKLLSRTRLDALNNLILFIKLLNRIRLHGISNFRIGLLNKIYSWNEYIVEFYPYAAFAYIYKNHCKFII